MRCYLCCCIQPERPLNVIVVMWTCDSQTSGFIVQTVQDRDIVTMADWVISVYTQYVILEASISRQSTAIIVLLTNKVPTSVGPSCNQPGASHVLYSYEIAPEFSVTCSSPDFGQVFTLNLNSQHLPCILCMWIVSPTISDKLLHTTLLSCIVQTEPNTLRIPKPKQKVWFWTKAPVLQSLVEATVPGM